MSRDEGTIALVASTQAALGDIHHLTPTDLASYVGQLAGQVTALAGQPEPPALEAELLLDRYGGTFARARFDAAAWPLCPLYDGLDHWVRFVIGPAGAGGAALADTAELVSIGGVVWYDKDGGLGHVKAANGQDVGVAAMRTWVDSSKHARVRHSMDGTHPVLTVLELADQEAPAALEAGWDGAGAMERSGEWTPRLLVGSTPSTVAHLNPPKGRWVRHGWLVFITATIELDAAPSETGSLHLGGVPFVAERGPSGVTWTYPLAVGGFAGLKAPTQLGATLSGSQLPTISLRKTDAQGREAPLMAADVDALSIIVSGVYECGGALNAEPLT
jgi:hypothetical protein